MSSSSPTMQEDNKAEMIRNDFRVKDLSFFTGTWGEQAKWPRLLVTCDSDIPCTHEQFRKLVGTNKEGGASSKKSIHVNMVVIDAVDDGFTKVPLFKDGNSFKNAEGAKPVSKLVDCERLGPGFKDVLCWPWTMVRDNPQAKGMLKDAPEDAHLSFRLQPGMVIRHTVWEDSVRGYPAKERKSTASKEMIIKGAEDMDVIPAFTILVVEVAVKAWCTRVLGEDYIDATCGQPKKRQEKDLSPAMKQFGISIGDMRLAGGTAYSCASKLRGAICSTVQESLALQKLHVDCYQSIAKALQITQAPMYVKDLSPDTSFLFDAENGLIKLSQWSSGLEEMAIDITVDDVKRFTNCKEVSEGMALLEFACQAGCLEMLCVHNRYRRNRADTDPIYSELHGVPILNVSKLLACIKFDPDDTTSLRTYSKDDRYFEFDADYKVMNFTDAGEPDKLYRPKIIVSKDPVTGIGGGLARPPCPDLALVGTGFCIEKAYLVRFINTITGAVACTAYFNLSKPAMMNKSSCGNVLGGEGSRLVRKRWASGQMANKTTGTGGSSDPFESSLPPSSSAAAFTVSKAVMKEIENEEEEYEEEEEVATTTTTSAGVIENIEEEEEEEEEPVVPVKKHNNNNKKAKKRGFD